MLQAHVEHRPVQRGHGSSQPHRNGLDERINGLGIAWFWRIYADNAMGWKRDAWRARMDTIHPVLWIDWDTGECVILAIAVTWFDWILSRLLTCSLTVSFTRTRNVAKLLRTAVAELSPYIAGLRTAVANGVRRLLATFAGFSNILANITELLTNESVL